MPVTVVQGRRLALSNLEKVLYPATGFTKGEALHYYAQVAPVLLPHVSGRPLMLLRYPDGVAGQKFTKHVPPGTPEWVHVCEVHRKSGGTRQQVLIEDLPSLMWAANMAALELHTPQWRAERQRVCDRLVIDLAPGDPATIVECCRVALWLRERLAADGLHACPKTSGGKGLHLLAPVEHTPCEQTAAYARRLAREAQAELPDLVVHRMSKTLRRDKVFLDHSQNVAGKTTAAPYTLRAQEQPTVSTPLTWKEVAACRAPEELFFTAEDVAGRATSLGDLLSPLLDPGLARPLR